MSDSTVNLQMPYILPSQAQKHVTHNEALQRLDAVTQLVIVAQIAAPPASPVEGACYAVAAAATGGWAGKSGQIAFRQDGAWIFITPREGWQAWFLAPSQLAIFVSGAWTPLSLPAPHELGLDRLGINATADDTNRLALASPASLFNNAGNGHQLKVNKSASADTASLMFQSGWQGHAEMGLAGDNDFSVKVSADGSSWKTALRISADGAIATPYRPAVRAALADSVLAPASGTQTGFSALAVNRGSFSLGAAVAGGGSRLIVPVSGLYLLGLSARILSSSGHRITLTLNGAATLLALDGVHTDAGAVSQSATGIAALQSGDWLTLGHSGTASIDFGPGKTEILAVAA
jgi:hypothetical protein